MIRRIYHHPYITLNFAFFIIWLILTPIAYYAGWLQSVTFISILSLAALAVTNLAGWFAEIKLMRKEAEEFRQTKGEE